jgi:hypothetical protein
MLPENKKPFILAGRKVISWYHPCFIVSVSDERGDGGPEEARTPDLIHAMDALFQLRYRPILYFRE